ncbi:MAG TPA: tetratricopeptide repeat protein, partial [Candidatus Sulfopaludibacter sp.]|nr:tetratricopeptide repeat protein [Candidatus Sulfopaludibacter sp.]
FNLGSALLHQKRFAEAESLLRGALAVRPDSPEVRTALGAALSGQDRLEEAEAECRQVITAQPESVEGWTELGLICADLGRTTDALACLDVAVRLRPEYAKAHFARSISLLREGRMAEGFAEYEWRWPMLAERPRACARPAWDGGPLNGKTILLSAEQGLGDAIQFVRYAPLVAARGGRVVVEVPEKLGPLVRTAAGVADVVTPAMPLPPFDEQAPLMSLPRIFGATLETIPAAIPYLRADERLTEEMRVGLGRAQGPRIGLAWAGNPDHLANRRRSLTLEALAPLERLPGIEWYSLHAGDRACAQARASGWLRAVLSDSGGVAELAALMSCLDLVISVDSMPAHLAGALGRPVWTLLCLAADWRWLREREDAPWYPGMRLFRQTRRGDWEGVVARVCREIAKGAVQGFDHRTDKHS